jgi:hypothetical protein
MKITELFVREMMKTKVQEKDCEENHKGDSATGLATVDDKYANSSSLIPSPSPTSPEPSVFEDIHCHPSRGSSMKKAVVCSSEKTHIPSKKIGNSEIHV